MFSMFITCTYIHTSARSELIYITDFKGTICTYVHWQ